MLRLFFLELRKISKKSKIEARFFVFSFLNRSTSSSPNSSSNGGSSEILSAPSLTTTTKNLKNWKGIISDKDAKRTKRTKKCVVQIDKPPSIQMLQQRQFIKHQQQRSNGVENF